ncbi:hypothetical protein A4X09_0g6148 [Tilletia walkeri]|uniref:Dynactin subunit 2 n=1 Tax=Tilletia walkeri TaxID=117179 RepID=A0A8X7N484_9BASI|nr:hypothetical protein A4X09_0g6148 [Tilletia walkeri]
MSLSKYTDLPDIDIAGQDLYETPEVPSPSFSDDEADDPILSQNTAGGPRSSSQQAGRKSGIAPPLPTSGPVVPASGAGGGIAKTSIDVEGATAKFQRATEADARGADFSGALHTTKKTRTYPPTHTFETTTYQIRGFSSTPSTTTLETPLEKLRRLRAETAALEEELEKPSQDHPEGEGEGDGVSPLKILEELRRLRVDLGRMDVEESSGVGVGWEGDARALIEKLGSNRGGEKVSGEDEGEGGKTSQAGGSTSVGSSKDLVQLESRLTNMENLVGVRPALIDESKAPSRPLLPTMQRLEHQLTLFTQPRHLDAISRRVKVLVAELERAHEARSKLAALPPAAPTTLKTSAAAATEGESKEGEEQGDGNVATSTAFGTPDQLARLRSLFLLQTRLEPLLPLTPHILSRLQSLSALHASSAHFAQSLDALLEADEKLGERVRELGMLCEGLRESCVGDEERVKGNLELVQARMESLGKRMEALGV